MLGELIRITYRHEAIISQIDIFAASILLADYYTAAADIMAGKKREQKISAGQNEDSHAIYIYKYRQCAHDAHVISNRKASLLDRRMRQWRRIGRVLMAAESCVPACTIAISAMPPLNKMLMTAYGSRLAASNRQCCVANTAFSSEIH